MPLLVARFYALCFNTSYLGFVLSQTGEAFADERARRETGRLRFNRLLTADVGHLAVESTPEHPHGIEPGVDSALIIDPEGRQAAAATPLEAVPKRGNRSSLKMPAFPAAGVRLLPFSTRAAAAG
jgi:hypothetical protein